MGLGYGRGVRCHILTEELGNENLQWIRTASLVKGGKFIQCKLEVLERIFYRYVLNEVNGIQVFLGQ